MTTTPRTILGVFAHPDDESMGPGGTFAKYARAGHRVCFVTATDGGAGRLFKDRPDDSTDLRKTRRDETAAAAAVLGAESLGFLDWEDGRLHERNVLEVEIELAKLFRRERPDVVITFHGSGISYHPDHRVLTLATTGAFLGAARPRWYLDESVDELEPHRIAKLYHYTAPRSMMNQVDWPRSAYTSPEDEITTAIDTTATADTKWKAIEAHATQQDGPPFRRVYDAGGFEREVFVRIFPTWHDGDPIETDLLEGLP